MAYSIMIMGRHRSEEVSRKKPCGETNRLLKKDTFSSVMDRADLVPANHHPYQSGPIQSQKDPEDATKSILLDPQ